MFEQAVVEKIIKKRKKGDIVLLKKIRPDACHHCHGKIICGVKDNFTFKAVDQSSDNLQEGDLVEYQLPDVSVIKLSFLVYSVPLLFFLITIMLISWFLPNHDMIAVLIGIIVMGLTFLLIGWYDGKTNKDEERRLPKIQEKIDS